MAGLQQTTTLNDGVLMPTFGLGTYKISPDTNDEAAADRVAYAIKELGYRLIDTAQFYENEKVVGEGVRKSGVPREDLFVVSKVWTSNTGHDACSESVQDSLNKLDIGYVDLFLIHAPTGDGKVVETYKTLLKFKEKGLIRSVGVSNFGAQHIEGLIAAGCPKPSVNQIELHPFYRQDNIVDYCRKNDIAVMGWSPLAKGRKGFENNTLMEIAHRHNKSVPQVMIRWSVQQGFITIPKSGCKDRMKENCSVVDFTLTQEDLEELKNLPQRTCSWEPQLSPWNG